MTALQRASIKLSFFLGSHLLRLNLENKLRFDEGLDGFDQGREDLLVLNSDKKVSDVSGPKIDSRWVITRGYLFAPCLIRSSTVLRQASVSTQSPVRNFTAFR